MCNISFVKEYEINQKEGKNNTKEKKMCNPSSMAHISLIHIYINCILLFCYASAKSFRTLCDTVCQNNILKNVFT